MASDARVRYTKMVIMVNFKAEEETYKTICSPNGDPAFPA